MVVVGVVVTAVLVGSLLRERGRYEPRHRVDVEPVGWDDVR